MPLAPDMSFSKDWETIKRIVEESQRFLITTHVNADPDAVGSELALAEGLRSLAKQPTILNPTKLSKHYAFLDPQSEVQEYSGDDLNNDSFDAVFILDISRWERLGGLADPIRLCGRPKICIDHHPYTGGFSDHHLVNVNACASAEIVYDLLRYLNVPLSKRIAECIYISILADTGAFTFSNTKDRTHHIVADLLSYGICARTLYESLYQNHTPQRLKFLGKVLGSLQFDCDQRLAWTTVSYQMLQENQMTQDDLEGFVDIPRNCRSVLLSMLFAEVEPNDIKISLRSKGDFHCNQLAAKFDGGGHSHASGIRVIGNLAEIENALLSEARKALKPFLNENVAASA
jgi:bifunctional oligoribonuclease and PAP phosphatase NrnA